MCDVSNNTGYFGYGEAPGETGNAAETANRKAKFEALIQQANSVPLLTIFKHYGIYLNEGNRRTVCPFLHHKKGRENTPSFNYYPDKNTFWCFGCQTGARPCDFVANIDGVSRITAAQKILKLFEGDLEQEIIPREDTAERLEILQSFSNAVREFHQNHNTPEDFIFIEGICKAYDSVNNRFKVLSNEGLRRTTESCLKKIGDYLSCK